MTPRTIWLARHGNRQDFVDFEWRKTAARPHDPGLSPDGFIQAHELGLRLESESIDHLFASPFLRTIQTAQKVADVLNLDIKLEHGLGEHIKPRGFSHQPEILSRSQVNHQFCRIDQHYDSLVMPQYPEKMVELRQRSRQTINALLHNCEGNLLLISHAATITNLALPLTSHVSRRDSPLCGLTKLVCRNDQWTIEIQRDAAHISHPPNRMVAFLKYWSRRALPDF